MDVVHVMMAVSMAGMLTGWLTGAWSNAWVVPFVGSTAWFGLRVVREFASRSPSIAAGAHLPPMVASAAMLYMLFAMNSTTTSHGMGDMATGGARDPMLDGAVAVVLVADALIAAGRAVMPQLVAQPVVAEQFPAASGSTPGGAEVASGRPVVSRVASGGALAPRATSACLVIMSLAMAYMFLTVRP